MSEFLKNNPIALRHCLLYEFLQGKCAEKAFVDVSQTVGKVVMNKEQIQILFRRFAKGKFYKNSKKNDQVTAKDIFQSDKKALRTRILYLSLKSQKKTDGNRYLSRFNPSFVMYEEFRKVIGDGFMEYLEFDFWFHRFLNGEYDLNFEREKDKKIYELVDMPIDVMEKIVEYLDIFNRMSLTKTSRSLHTFTEDQKLFHHTLELTLNRYGPSKIRFDEKHPLYYADWKEAILDFKNIIKRPKFHLNILIIDLSNLYDDPFDDQEYSLGSVTHQLHVKKLSFKANFPESLLNILPALKPEFLSTIDIFVASPGVYHGIDEIFEMEQWKKAQYLSIEGYGRFTGSLHHMYHFKEFSLCCWQLFEEDIREMKEILFKSPVFKKCSLTLYFPVDSSAIEQEFGEAVRGTPTTFHHPILNSNEYFEIKVSMKTLNEQKIEIARKMR